MKSKYPLSCRGVLPSTDGKGKLALQQVSIPQPKENEMLVQVLAVGVNHADIAQAKGHYPPPPGAPETLGPELAGVVIDTGSHVTKFKKGDRIMSLVTGGAYAEFAIVQEETSLPIPEAMSFNEAAAIPEAYFTIWYNVFMKGKLQAGEVFLVHGGVSGVGSAAVQIAKAMGAVVIATVGADNKMAACVKLGADYVINYKHQPLEKSILKFTNNQGIDVVLDWVGAEYLEMHMKLLRKNGRLLCINTRESKHLLDFELLLGKCLTITGSLLRPLPLTEKAKIANEIEIHLLPLLMSQQIKPLISSVIPLEDVQKAHQILEESTHIGKVILSVNQ